MQFWEKDQEFFIHSHSSSKISPVEKEVCESVSSLDQPELSSSTTPKEGSPVAAAMPKQATTSTPEVPLAALLDDRNSLANVDEVVQAVTDDIQQEHPVYEESVDPEVVRAVKEQLVKDVSADPEVVVNEPFSLEESHDWIFDQLIIETLIETFDPA